MYRWILSPWDEQEQIPSTEKQLKLAAMLKEELEDMGVSGVRMDEHGYVYGYIPANTDKKIPAVGFISHIDTAPAASRCKYQSKNSEEFMMEKQFF